MKKILFLACATLALSGSLKAQNDYYYSTPAPVEGTRAGVSLAVIGVGIVAAGAAVAIFFASNSGNDNSSHS